MTHHSYWDVIVWHAMNRIQFAQTNRMHFGIANMKSISVHFDLYFYYVNVNVKKKEHYAYKMENLYTLC